MPSERVTTGRCLVDQLVAGQDENHHSGQESQGYLNPCGRFFYSQGINDGGNCQDHSYVKDIAADDIPHHDVGILLHRSEYVDHQLRGGSAESHDGQSDYNVGDIEPFGQGGGIVHQKVGPIDEREKSRDQ